MWNCKKCKSTSKSRFGFHDVWKILMWICQNVQIHIKKSFRDSLQESGGAVPRPVSGFSAIAGPASCGQSQDVSAIAGGATLRPVSGFSAIAGAPSRGQSQDFRLLQGRRPAVSLRIFGYWRAGVPHLTLCFQPNILPNRPLVEKEWSALPDMTILYTKICSYHKCIAAAMLQQGVINCELKYRSTRTAMNQSF